MKEIKKKSGEAGMIPTKTLAELSNRFDEIISRLRFSGYFKFTFLYDVAEEQSTTLKKLELWAKQSVINQIVVPKDWRIYVSKSTYAEIQKRPNGAMFIQIQNPENIEIRKEK